MIYLDNAATTFKKPYEVKKAVIEAMEKYSANPGRSGHELSFNVADKIFETREIVKNFFNAENCNVVFTKNCTEALNFAILGTIKAGDHVIASVYEHNSVLRPLEHLKEQGVELTILDCNLNQFHNELEKEIKTNTKMVITTSVSNVNGEVCNLFEVGKICAKHKLLYLVDGAQGAGHIEIDMEKMNISMLAFAGHKGLLSITGVGGLVVKNEIKLKPILFGGTGTDSENLAQPEYMPEGFESGTIATVPILSLKAGVEFLHKNFEKIIKKEQKLSKKAYFELKKLNFLEIYSKKDSCNVFSFNIKNQDSTAVAELLNEYQICVRSGLHCAPLIHKKMGTIKSGAVRVSIDFYNTEQEIDLLISALKNINLKLNS